MQSLILRATSGALIVALAALAGCGGRQPLQRTEGMKPVPVAVGANESASADALMALTPQERPNRDFEPLTRSQPRPEDPFDLPPGQ
ncbi:hypothetical protein [Sphingobium subterraneum]|uniref:Putative small lipoprotein YifL n=1 Tax=Sphingobium subterraneum TaxID=627688 RepID=A0A841J2B2_9SPHN|nr:hypothetical protein [Sphingobium subterraneum]MBB6124844.1 putative small lipoprotein YifL [Sphingobium subterraneum]